eukprot:16319586-Heterocapsa_arctica.AAC.1
MGPHRRGLEEAGQGVPYNLITSRPRGAQVADGGHEGDGSRQVSPRRLGRAHAAAVVGSPIGSSGRAHQRPG